MRSVFVISGVVSGGVLLSAVLHPAWMRDGQRWFMSVLHNEASHISPAEVEARAGMQLSCTRQEEHLGKLLDDDVLREWVAAHIERDGLDDVGALVKQAQVAQPNYLRISAYAAQSPSVDGLMEQLAQWSGQSGEELTHRAIVARTRPAMLGFECVVLVGQRLPTFTPEGMSNASDGFYSICPLCGRGQLCHIQARSRSVSLDCPNCHRVYAMLAVDTRGRFHYVNEYLTGWQPPSHFPAGLTRYQEMCLIWKRVVTSIRYLSDATESDPDADIWQFAAETMRLGHGDCEDSAILLADWLIARGFEARVAVGRFGELGGHAWVMVRLDKKSYLLEVTNPSVSMTVPPLAQDVGSRYVPAVTFDPSATYLRIDGNAPWDGDCWSNSTWCRIVPRPRQKDAPVLAQETRAPAPVTGQ